MNSQDLLIHASTAKDAIYRLHEMARHLLDRAEAAETQVRELKKREAIENIARERDEAIRERDYTQDEAIAWKRNSVRLKQDLDKHAAALTKMDRRRNAWRARCEEARRELLALKTADPSQAMIEQLRRERDHAQHNHDQRAKENYQLRKERAALTREIAALKAPATIEGRLDKPFHRPECRCLSCVRWIEEHPEPSKE